MLRHIEKQNKKIMLHVCVFVLIFFCLFQKQKYMHNLYRETTLKSHHVYVKQIFVHRRQTDKQTGINKSHNNIMIMTKHEQQLLKCKVMHK